MDAVYEPIPTTKRLDISYTPVLEYSPSIGGEKPSRAPKPRPHRRSRIVLHWLGHVLSVLWLIPMITLLYLNFGNYIIGASAWCPNGNCNAESTTDNAIQRANQLDRRDHNLNGALQFVAKALEAWFVFIATGLVYDIGILFAKKGRGLPVGYLLSHLEFTDIRYILNPLLWTSPLPHRTSTPEKRARTIKLYIFAVITALLTILANLMGPSTAVLVLPTLQWIETPHLINETFNGTAAGLQPRGNQTIQGCDDTQLLARNYTCTAKVYGPSLDEWAAQGISSGKQAIHPNGFLILGSSQEAALQFQLNATASNEIFWVPSRQVLRAMSHEYLKTSGDLMDAKPPEYPDKLFNNSLQTVLHQQGPTLGVQAGCYSGNYTDLTLNDGRWIRCYTGWGGDDIGLYTKCLRLGIGYDDSKYNAKFYLQNMNESSNANESTPDYDSGIGAYYADKATYFNDTEDFGSGIKACLSNETSVTCDWDKIFDTPLPIELRNTSVNVGLISYRVPEAPNDDARVYCDHVVHLSFPTYSVDTSSRSNSQNMVTLDNLPRKQPETIPLVFHPDWYLAAWSVDHDTALDGNRQIVKELKRVLPAVYAYDNGSSSWDTMVEFLFLHYYALGQSLSMVNYDWYPAPVDPSSAQAREAEKDTTHPILHTYASIHVWAYGLGSRTSKLGVAVVILGSVCVLARLLLGLTTGIQGRSTVEVLAAAFEHRHQGEFEGMEEEGHLAKVRYQVVEDGEGKQRFIPEKRTSRWSHAMST